MAKKYLDSVGLARLWNKINSIFVAKEAGKGLSSNDYTDDDKAKLDDIEANANNYSLPVADSELGGVKSGGDIIIQSDGTMQVVDDSHNHIIANVDGLQEALNKKRNGDKGNVRLVDGFDWNTLTDAGAYEIQAVGSFPIGLNAPVGAYGYGTLIVEVAGKDSILQTYFPHSTGRIYRRMKYLGGEWDAWKQFRDDDYYSQTYATKTENNEKVDKVSGMGLSHNDYTDEEKDKLDGIASGAEVNTIVAIQRNGTAITPKDRVVNILVPVKTSEINNDSSYQTAADVAETIVGVKLDIASGIITLTRKNGTTFTLDLPTEKIIKSGRYDNETKEIVLVLEDESEIRFSASELIDEYYADESTLELYTDTADGNKKKFRIKTAYKNKIDGSEQTTNKTASVSSSSTETQYPTAKAVYNAVKDLATKVQTFTTSSTRANIESGETIATIFGKIRKWFVDLKAVAFTGSLADLSDKTMTNLTQEASADVLDSTLVVTSNIGGIGTDSSIYRRPATSFWNYINGKISSVLGLTASAYSGVASNSVNLRGAHYYRNNSGLYQLIGGFSIDYAAFQDRSCVLLIITVR